MESKQKKQKTAAAVAQPVSEEELKALIEDFESVQGQLDELDAQEDEETLAVARKYRAAKKEHFEKRQALLRKIPKFWSVAFLNHPMIEDLATPEDEQALEALTEINVEEHNDKEDFKIVFTFDKNPYFSNKTLWKEVRFNEEGFPEIFASKISWQKGKDLTKCKHQHEEGDKQQKEGKKRSREEMQADEEDDHENVSFFQWFAAEEQDVELAEVVKEFWANPMPYYEGLDDFDEDDDEEDEDEDEEEEEEEEEQEEEKETVAEVAKKPQQQQQQKKGGQPQKQQQQQKKGGQQPQQQKKGGQQQNNNNKKGGQPQQQNNKKGGQPQQQQKKGGQQQQQKKGGQQGRKK
ncbi:putative Nucleosome assembly protein (NAP) [Balamuthia mandrillaris]